MITAKVNIVVSFTVKKLTMQSHLNGNIEYYYNCPQGGGWGIYKIKLMLAKTEHNKIVHD